MIQPLSPNLPRVAISVRQPWAWAIAAGHKAVDDRIPHLLATPAAKHFISAEPLLGPLSLESQGTLTAPSGKARIDWVICGGESGPNARPGKRRAGRELDGALWDQMPTTLENGG